MRLFTGVAQVSVCVHDEAAVIWAGEETPCALGVVCSIGSINQENNAALTAAISELIEPFGVSSDRIYLNVCQPRPARAALPCTACLRALLHLARGTAHRRTLLAEWLLLAIPPLAASLNAQFFDVPRENCGWSGRTFAG